MEKFKYKLTFTMEGLKEHGAVISFKRSLPKNKVWMHKNVEISRKLRKMLQNNPEKYNGVVFESTNQDPKWINNPYKLICYKPEGDSDIPEHFRVEIVNEMSSKPITLFHADGEKYIEWVPRQLTPSLYRRYRTSFNTKMLKDLHDTVRNAIKDPIVIVIPA